VFDGEQQGANNAKNIVVLLLVVGVVQKQSKCDLPFDLFDVK
jgi:hypothetical protein